jgi:hypothetical protein
MFWSGYRKDRKDLRKARTETELQWLAGERTLIAKVFEAAQEGKFDDADRISRYVASPASPALARSVPDAESPHEKALDGWRVAITGVLVIALFTVVVIIVVQNSTNSAAAPYVSLLSGLAGIALGWMFANATGGKSDRRTVPPSAGLPALPARVQPQGQTPPVPAVAPESQADPVNAPPQGSGSSG